MSGTVLDINTICKSKISIYEFTMRNMIVIDPNSHFVLTLFSLSTYNQYEVTKSLYPVSKIYV